MKIQPHLLIDARHLDGRGTGLSRYIEGLVRALPNACDMTITLVSNRKISPQRDLPNINIYQDHSCLRFIPGTIWLSLRIPIVMKQIKGNCFLGTQHVLPLFKNRNVLYGLVIHDLVYKYFPETMTLSNRWLSRIFIPASIRRADVLLAVSRSTLQDVEKNYPSVTDRRSYVYSGADFKKLDTDMEQHEGELRILFVGSQEPRKNLHKLLKAFILAKSKGFNARLDVVSGAAWSSSDIDTILATRPEGVFTHRGVDDTYLNILYQQADFLAFPSLYEGFGFPIIEALNKCAIIANNIPVFRELGEIIDGIEFIDFNAPIELITEKILLLKRRAPATLKQTMNSEIFTWSNTAREVCKAMGLR